MKQVQLQKPELFTTLFFLDNLIMKVNWEHHLKYKTRLKPAGSLIQMPKLSIWAL